MWAAGQLLARGRRVGVDMEDWFSEDLLPEVRRDRPLRLLRELEQTLLAGGAYRTCTSKAMSEVLATAYHCERPAVIYNAFPWSERSKLDGDIKDRHDRSLPSIHWFSQTIGRGRGLEDLLAALPHLKTRVEVHLRGEATTVTHAWISGSVPSDFRPRIFIHSLVHNDELLSRIAEHDIGFAGEPKQPASRDLTVTNKVLQYLLAGIAVVASDTAGQREVAQQASGAVYLYRAGDARHLARQLDFLLSSVTELKKAKSAAVAAANETFCWEKQAPLLLSAVEAALR
jgi:glycosyltransferase involved in cell wall biosynthesis